jgi:hypothetical protein
MNKKATRANNTAQATSQTESQENNQAENPQPQMQVLKPEPEPEQSTDKPNINDVIRRVNEKFYLSEQHTNRIQQLNKLHDFKSRINDSTHLALFNEDGQSTFRSQDPAAVETLIEICIQNIKDKISDLENLIIAA